MSNARYRISPSQAKTKARLLMELAGGKSVLPYCHALEAVALGCGFPDWHSLSTDLEQRKDGESHTGLEDAALLMDDLHIDSANVPPARKINSWLSGSSLIAHLPKRKSW